MRLLEMLKRNFKSSISCRSYVTLAKNGFVFALRYRKLAHDIEKWRAFFKVVMNVWTVHEQGIFS
jgi:hypothetical protein